ncbi:DUF6273 domain-containing protein [Candidatus Bathycorpusculum sp.]|uniref:DUF6273 domain-containing protein n=1 Tax=Candidatus Bathycorpusculum sp. TaxID=2994959 RepID=UPI00282C0A33|nr:DUF6273 domain-containing protein [Candidatus Termitimicrobium sp.]
MNINNVKSTTPNSRGLQKNIIVLTLSIMLLASSLFVCGFVAAGGVNGRTLTASLTGDTSDWIEIATSGEYSLILRKENLPNSRIPFANSYVSYPTSDARTFVNNWFKNTLSSTARIRDFTVQNNANTTLGAFASTGSGLSTPSSAPARTGDDVAFLLSFAEASLYCSKQYATSTTNWVNSPSIAQSNYGKLTIPSGQQNDFWWLRSPGATSTSTSSVGSHSPALADLVYQSSTIGGYPYIRPALWVKSNVFDYSITYELDGGSNAVNNPVSFASGVLPLSIANPNKSGYTFLGWTVRYAAGSTIIGTPTTSCTIPSGTTGDIIITANWTPQPVNVSYTVHYYLDGTTVSICQDKVVSGQVMGSWITEYAINVAGYTPSYPYSASGVLNATGNVFVIYYSANPLVTYTVHYYLEGTTTKIADSKNVTGQVLGSWITEYAINVAGYTPTYPSVGGVLTAPNNVFVFNYSANTNIAYTVHYYLIGTSTKVTDSKNVTSQTMGTLITENATNVAGYIAVAPTSVSGVLNATSNEFVFYYTASTVSYEVHYYLQVTSVQVVADKIVYGQVLGSWVTEYAVEVWGYIAVAPTSVSGVLNATSNEFVFYYTIDPNAK